MNTLDCLIIGGGPAGLVAGEYLRRFRRDVAILDAGDSRAALIPKTHNTPGFPEGISGRDLLDRMRAHVLRYDAPILRAQARTAHKTADGFVVETAQGAFRARTLLIASGVSNHVPPVPDHDAALARGLVRYCPVCDGHEVIDKRIAVLTNSARGVAEVDFLRTYSSTITLIATDPSAAAEIAEAGGVCAGLWGSSTLRGEAIAITIAGADQERTFDTLYVCLGVTHRTEISRALGAAHSEAGGILTDAHQRTNIAGLYAAGDVVEALDQIAVAAGHAAIAATAIHNDLR